MPIYEARCQQCGKLVDYYQTAQNCRETPICCNLPMEKVILTAPMGYVDNVYYQSPIDGRPITTKQARIEDMRRNNCRPWEGLDQEKKEAARRQSYDEAKADAKLESCIIDAIKHMAPEARETLGVA